MRPGKALALLLALTMLLISFSSVLADRGVSVYWLEDYFNDPCCNLHYTNGNPGYTGIEDTDESGVTRRCIKSTTSGQDSTYAEIYSEAFYLAVGDWVQFEYWYDTEEDYDKLMFFDNDVVKLTKSGKSGDGENPVWVSYTYTCSEPGEHVFRWSYHKDQTGSSGEDCVKLSGFKTKRHFNWYVEKAAINAGGGGNVIEVLNNSAYPMTVQKYPDPYTALYVKNGNAGVGSSSSTLTVNFWVAEASEASPAELSFDYAVSSEAGYDEFIFKADGTEVFRDSGTDHYTWTHLTFDITTTGRHIFTWTYQKDSSVDGGADTLCIDNIRISDVGASARAEALYSSLNALGTNAQLVFNTPAGISGFVPTAANYGEDIYFMANNRYVDGSEAFVETIVNMAANETLSFQYYVSCENGFDKLIFYANGSQIMSASGYERSSWETYTFTASETRAYHFKWVYHKDSSNSFGRDFAAIDTVRYLGSRHNSFTLQDAIIGSGNQGTITITSTPSEIGCDRFIAYDSPEGPCVISGNRYFENTGSYIVLTAENVEPGDVIVFDYNVGAEEYNDCLEFYCFFAGESDYVQSGNYTTGGTWAHFEYTSTRAGTMVFSFAYVKDGGIDVAPDCAKIRNFKLIRAGGSTVTPGDADGDGHVTISDALIALRASMGLITLTADQRTACDVNGDGAVTINDALLILRASMGLITL